MQTYTHYQCIKKKIAYGTKNFPWSLNKINKKINFKKESLPIAENLHKNDFFAIELCLYDFNFKDIEFIVKNFKKAWNELNINK